MEDGVDFNQKLLSVIPSDVLIPLVRKFSSMGWHVHHADILLPFWMETSIVSCTFRATAKPTIYRKLCMV